VLVVHAPPAATSAAALSWASAADAALLVVPADGGSRGPVAATAENLPVIGARLLGVVRLADRPVRRIEGRRRAGDAEAEGGRSPASQAAPVGDALAERTTTRRSREPAARRR
jgi:hypothetical protein